MKRLILRTRRAVAADRFDIQQYVLDKFVYTMANAQAIVNYGLARNQKFSFDLADGNTITVDPVEFLVRDVRSGGGAISLMWEEGGAD